MSIRVEQGYFDMNPAVDSSGIFRSADIPYFVFGAADETEAINEAYAQIPESFNGLFRKSIKMSERINETSFKVVATYSGPDGKIENINKDEDSFSFDTTGGTQTVKQGIDHVAQYPNDAADMHGMINFDGEDVNGVEIIQSVQNFTHTVAFDAYEITTDFRKKLTLFTGCVNTSPWRGYEKGEVLFRGVTGSGKYHLPCELTFNFSFSANMKDFYLGSILVHEKYGWDYHWARYKKIIQDKTVVYTPIAVYIERLFYYVDFKELGIGY